MAKEPSKPADAAAGDAAPKKGKKLVLIIVLVLVLAIAGGAAFMLLGHKKHAEGDEEEADSAPEPPKVKVDPSKPPVFVTLDQFTVNLAGDGGGERFLQATIVLRVADAHVDQQLKLYLPELRHRILMLLSAKTAAELSSTDGREQLADDIREDANDILGYPPNPKKNPKKHRPEDDGPVLSVLFNQFIVQ